MVSGWVWFMTTSSDFLPTSKLTSSGIVGHCAKGAGENFARIPTYITHTYTFRCDILSQSFYSGCR